MKKLTFILTIILLIAFNTNTIYAQSTVSTTVDTNSYNSDGTIKIISSLRGFEDRVYQGEIWKIDSAIPKITFYIPDGKIITGKVSYPNYNDMTTGDFDLQWVFTPDDNKYETKSGVFHFKIYPADTEESKGKLPTDTNTEEVETLPSLTATSLLLTSIDTTYDVNINNRPTSASYLWKSNNTKVAKVNKSGVITPVGEGEAIITCDITLPDDTVSTLSTEVIIGSDDDNSPTLSDEDLTLEVGELFDLDVENGIKGSKIKFTSLDKSIAKITSTTGKITALKTGNTAILCTITSKDGKVVVLSTDVIVEN